MDEWITTIRCMHTMEYYATLKRKKYCNLWKCGRTKGISKISQTHKDKSYMMSLILKIERSKIHKSKKEEGDHQGLHDGAGEIMIKEHKTSVRQEEYTQERYCTEWL